MKNSTLVIGLISMSIMITSCEKENQSYISILSPSQGLKWKTNHTYTISWVDNISENVDIRLFKNGVVIEDIGLDVESNGEFIWYIKEVEFGTDYTIRITSINNSTIFAESSNFEIILGVPLNLYTDYLWQDMDVEGKSLRIYEGGSGKNLFIFEHGMGGDASVWFQNKMLQFIADSNRFIAYNRSGYPPSTFNGEDRGLANITNDLNSIINQKSPDNKVILVGWSWGGPIIRYYSVYYPEKVKALLFIDPSHEKGNYYTQTLEDQLVTQFINKGNKGAELEARQFLETFSVLGTLPNLPDIPVIVLTSVVPNDTKWTYSHSTLGAGVSDFTHVTTSTAGHAIQMEDPELVLKYLLILAKY